MSEPRAEKIPDAELAAMLERCDKPTTPGFYWALWLTAAAGTHEGDQLTPANDWEIVEVWENHIGDEDSELEKFGVSVPGVRETQWLDDFRWGEKLPTYRTDLPRVVRRLRQVERENDSLRKLVAQVVKHPPFDSGVVHWGRVSEIFATGATSAIALCHEFDVDPDRMEWSCPECGKRQDVRGFCCDQCRLDFEASTK